MTHSYDRKSFNVALVGYGAAGSIFHAPLISTTPGLTLAAIVTANPERVAKAKQNFPKARLYADFSELLETPYDYDVVVIASPNRHHFHQADLALRSGLAVVVDKPMGTNAQECERLISLSKTENKLLTVFHNRRWDGDFLTVRAILDAGWLGDVTRFESRFERYRPTLKENAWRESGTTDDAGGLLFDLGSHLIDQACKLFGTPDSIYAECDVRRESAMVDDDSFVSLHFPSGVRAHLWASAVSRINGPRFRVLGMRGAYEKYGMDPQEDMLKAGMNPHSPGWGLDKQETRGTLHTRTGEINLEAHIDTITGSYESFYSQLRDAIEGIAPVPVEPTDALRTIRIIEAARMSAETGSPQKLADLPAATVESA